jgi:hypothetical protein
MQRAPFLSGEFWIDRSQIATDGRFGKGIRIISREIR